MSKNTHGAPANYASFYILSFQLHRNNNNTKAWNEDTSFNHEKFNLLINSLSYGGAFYALVDTRQLNMDVSHTPIDQLVRAADAVSSAVKKSVQLEHPESADLAFLYGTILTDGKDEYSEEPTANICVFADCEVWNQKFNTNC